MSSPERALRAIVERLVLHGVSGALVGGLAVSIRCEPRFTRDVDLAVAVDDDAHAERVVFCLRNDGYRVLTQLEHEKTGRLSTVRFAPPAGDTTGVVTDLLFASSGIETEIVESGELLEVVPGLHVIVARTGHLLALKVLSASESRPQDAIDVQALVCVAEDGDLQLARDACRLITDRGYHRGRDLASRLDEVLKRRGPQRQQIKREGESHWPQ